MNLPTQAAATHRMIRALVLGLLLASTTGLATVAGQPAADLQARYVALQDKLTHNVFQRPLFIDSTETSDQLKGDIFAVIKHPYANVSQAMQDVEHWCDILILHLNVKGCRVTRTSGTKFLEVSFGRKFDEPLDEAYPVNFKYRVAAADSDYLQILLHAETGPMGSENYRITFEAVPLPNGHTFIHLAYSYAYGLTARLAMKGYLATLGGSKVGFSVIDRRADGTAVLIGGVRGVVERNTMRYYLAIEAYLGSLSAPPAEQLEKRLQDWFAGTEQFSRQLHEIGKDEYLAMKRKEVLRQRSAAGPNPSR
jgi:hypothetical protein